MRMRDPAEQHGSRVSVCRSFLTALGYNERIQSGWWRAADESLASFYVGLLPGGFLESKQLILTTQTISLDHVLRRKNRCAKRLFSRFRD